MLTPSSATFNDARGRRGTRWVMKFMMPSQNTNEAT